MKTTKDFMGRFWVPLFLTVLFVTGCLVAIDDGKVWIKDPTVKQGTWSENPLSTIIGTGQFVNVLAGGTAGGNQQAIINSAPAGAVSLTLANSATDGAGSIASGGVTNVPGAGLLTYGSTFADADYAGYPVFRGTPLAAKNTRFQSADALDAAMPFEFHVGELSSTSKMFRIGIEGVDPITITPPALAANTDNWNPTGFAGAQVIRISASGATRDLTGMLAPASGSRRIVLQNSGLPSVNIVNQATSTAANQFLNSTEANIELSFGMAIEYIYDDTLNRWRDIGLNVQGVGASTEFVRLDGDLSSGEQVIQQDFDGALNLLIKNENISTLATAGFGLYSDDSNITFGAFGSTYTIPGQQSTSGIGASTGANGFAIDNTGGNPIFLRISADDYLSLRTTGITARAGAQSDVAVRVGGVYAFSSAQVGNVGAGEDTLYTTTIEGGTLDVDGKIIKIEAGGIIGNSAATKQIRVRFGSAGVNLAFDSAAAYTLAQRTWTLSVTIQRTGATAQVSFGEFNTGLSGVMLGNTHVEAGLDQTLSGDVDLTITGEATNTNDIVIGSSVVYFY